MQGGGRKGGTRIVSPHPVPLVAVDGRRVVAVRDRDGDGDDAGDVRLCVAFAWLAGGRATVNLDVCARLGSAVATLHERMASIRLGGKDDAVGPVWRRTRPDGRGSASA